MEQSKAPKSIACTIQVQPGSRAIVVPLDWDATDTAVDTNKDEDGLIKITGMTSGANGRDGMPVHFYIPPRTFADCHAGERIMVETALGWLDGIVQF